MLFKVQQYTLQNCLLLFITRNTYLLFRNYVCRFIVRQCTYSRIKNEIREKRLSAIREKFDTSPCINRRILKYTRNIAHGVLTLGIRA